MYVDPSPTRENAQDDADTLAPAPKSGDEGPPYSPGLEQDQTLAPSWSFLKLLENKKPCAIMKQIAHKEAERFFISRAKEKLPIVTEEALSNTSHKRQLNNSISLIFETDSDGNGT